MKKTKADWRCSFLLLLLLSAMSCAQTLQSNFFTWQGPDDWTVSRNSQGLWQAERQEPFEMSVTMLAVRLRTTPELYLQGTQELWKTQGETRVLGSGEKSFECLIIPREGSDRILKSLRWEKDLLLVASFTFPVKHTDEAMAGAASFAQGLEIRERTYDPESLRQDVLAELADHDNSGQGLLDATAVRQDMTSFRHDWEPYFSSQKSELYKAHLAYLEARYDAAFVVAYGKDMGIPETLLDSRLKAVENRKRRVLTLLESTEEIR